MRFHHIYHAIHFEPWLILPTAHDAIVRLLDSRMADGVNPAEAAVKAESLFPTPPKMTIQDGIAEIPLCGTMAKGVGPLEKMCGACSIEELQSNFAEAMSNPNIKGVLLNVSSPGGTVNGTPETAAMLRDLAGKKTCIAYTDTVMASGSYYVASQASMIIASQTATIGSIGVMMPIIDRSKAAEAMGVKVEVIKNTGAIYKGAGTPGTSLTDAQRENLQARIDEMAAMFKGDVLACRPGVKKDAMRGQVFLAAGAKDAGLIDEIGSYAYARASLLSAIKIKR